MKRTPKQTRSSPRQGSAKRQKSILSFFQTSRASTPGTKTSSASRPLTPSTTASLDNPPSGKPSPSVQCSVPEKQDSPGTLRRELFSIKDGHPPFGRDPKRKRILRLDDFSDEDEIPEIDALSSGFMADVATVDKRGATSCSKSSPKINTTGDFCRAGTRVGVTEERLDEQEKDCGQDRSEANMIDEASPEARFDFSCMQYRGRESVEGNMCALPPSQARRLARVKLGALNEGSRAAGDEEGGWCSKHPWTVDIRDAKRRRPDHPDYDKTTLYVPPGDLAERSRSTKEGGLSPFQKQFWSIKAANYDVLIFFKKGKFYELYDVDADVGHKQLGLNYTKGGRVDMRCCGVPEQAFEKHTARLIDLGFKVGRVEQTETANAAEKRKNGGGSNKSTVCERALVRILTKATATDDGLLRDHRARFVLSVVELREQAKLSNSDCSTSVDDDPLKGSTSTHNSTTSSVGVCYVDVASGSINIGEYDDDVRLSKTDRLMAFLRPQEIITDCSAVSHTLSNMIKWVSNKNDAEIVDTSRKSGYVNVTDSRLRKYLLSNSPSQEMKAEFERVRQHLQHFPLSSKAFGVMSSHLESLIIDKETLSLGNYHLFPEDPDSRGDAVVPNSTCGLLSQKSAFLRIDAPTLENLDVLSSTIDGSERGSLLSFVDRARTPAGRRLIRKWLSEPLVSSEAINDRLHAVEDIHRMEDGDGGQILGSILKRLKTPKDLERALPKLHRQATAVDVAVMFDDSNKLRVKDFVAVIRSLQESLNALEMFGENIELFAPQSKRLRWLYTLGCGVPSDALDKLNYFLGQAFDLHMAESNGEILPNDGAVPSYDTRRKALDAVEMGLAEQLEKWKKRLGDNSVKFYHRGKEPYQIEVKLNTLGGRTPEEFEVVSESKTTKRFYTRHVKSLIRRQIEAAEAFEEVSGQVARDMMGQFGKEHTTWLAVSKSSAELDALIGLALASRDVGSGAMCRPSILPNDHPEPFLQAEGLRHPILAAKSTTFVSNDVILGGASDPEIMILTGPNAGGKSTLARQVALSVILAQLGCFVPASRFCLRPFEDIFVRMGASDDLARGRSTFMVEMEEVGHILNNANSRSLVIADEVGRGTSTHDGYAVAFAALEHIGKVNKSITVFSTHYSHLGSDIVAASKASNRLRAGLFEMAAVIDEKNKIITFLYKLQPGSSGDSRGIYCARVAGISESIAKDAEKAALTFDRTVSTRLAAMKFADVLRHLDGNDEAALKALIYA